jgi:hypothetical protein
VSMSDLAVALEVIVDFLTHLAAAFDA